MQQLRTLVTATLCVACLTGFRFTTELVRISPAPPPAFTFIDERPSIQLKSGAESYMITNCAYGIYRIGARDITPDPAVMVQDILASRNNAALAGKQVALTNATVHLNSAVGLRGSVSQMYSGLIPNMMNKKEKVGCAPSDLRGGYFLGEVEGPAPLVVVLEVRVDDKLHRARCLAEMPEGAVWKSNAPPEKRALWNGAVSQAMHCALDALAMDVVATPAVPADPAAVPTSLGAPVSTGAAAEAVEPADAEG